MWNRRPVACCPGSLSEHDRLARRHAKVRPAVTQSTIIVSSCAWPFESASALPILVDVGQGAILDHAGVVDHIQRRSARKPDRERLRAVAAADLAAGRCAMVPSV